MNGFLELSKPNSNAAKAAGKINVKRSIFNRVIVATILGVSLAPQFSEAAEHDFRVGSFEGNWCGLAARFDITTKVGNTWDFKGKVLVRATGQYDNVVIRQNADNSLRIVRHLSGAHAGTTQWVDTHPPETKFHNGKRIVNFPVRRAGGYGAKVAGFLQMPVK